MLDTQAFATAQTRLASALTTIPPSKCHTALDLLRIFNASAPEADSTSVFLPQQRALFVLRHVAGWLTSDDVDEDKLPEDMEFRVLELEGSVAPIVQDVGGAHWDGIFDLVENGLEVTSSLHFRCYSGLTLNRIPEWTIPLRSVYYIIACPSFSRSEISVRPTSL